MMCDVIVIHMKALWPENQVTPLKSLHQESLLHRFLFNLVTLWLLLIWQHFTEQDLQAHPLNLTSKQYSDPFHILELLHIRVCTTHGMHLSDKRVRTDHSLFGDLFSLTTTLSWSSVYLHWFLLLRRNRTFSSSRSRPWNS